MEQLWSEYLLEVENLVILAAIVISIGIWLIPESKIRGDEKKKRLVGPPSPPPAKRIFTLGELCKYKGKEGEVLLACKGVIYHVDPTHYGPGAGYSIFAGKDITRHLGKMWVGDQETNQCWQNLTEKEVKILDDWEEKFQQKYDIWGWLEEDWVKPAIKPEELEDIVPSHQGGEEDMISNLKRD